jgi:RNA polymerase sigma factor (sigma-70 family)
MSTHDAGDGGFDAVYRKYYARIWRYYRSCHVSDDESHDLAQDAFKRFYERMGQLRGAEPFPFLRTIARTVLLNKIREQKAAKRSAQMVEIDAPNAEDIKAAPGVDYAEREFQESRRRDLHAAIDELSRAQRQVVRLWLDGFAYGEIAELLNITLDAVKSRKRDATRLLVARLGPETDPEVEE